MSLVLTIAIAIAIALTVIVLGVALGLALAVLRSLQIKPLNFCIVIFGDVFGYAGR